MLGHFLCSLLLVSTGALYAHAWESPVVITRLAADTNQHYEVAAEPCLKEGCSVTVELLAGQHVLDRHVLEMKFSSSRFEKSKLEPGDGFGDPSYSKPGTTVWRSGEDEDETVLVISPFLLQPGLTGILIDQRYGFEHVKRRHVLLAPKDNRLVELWKESEGAGPTYSTAVPVGISQGRESLLFYNVFFNPGDNASDKLHLQSLIYDSASGTMAPYSRQFNALVIGPFHTVAEARKQRSSHSSCSRALWVLPAKEFKGPANEYVLSTVASTSEIARSVETRLTSCKFDSNVSVVPMNRDAINLW
jgi:hypothetical protein